MKTFIFTLVFIFVYVLCFHSDFLHYAVWGDFEPNLGFVFWKIYTLATLVKQLQVRCVPAGLHLSLRTIDGCYKLQIETQPRQLVLLLLDIEQYFECAPSLVLGNTPVGFWTPRFSFSLDWALYWRPEGCNPGQQRGWEVRVMKVGSRNWQSRAMVLEKLLAKRRSYTLWITVTIEPER